MTTSTTSSTATAQTTYQTPIQSYTQSLSDVFPDSQKNQRNIGTLTQDKTSLTIQSGLNKTNTSDYYKFTVSADIKDAQVLIKGTGAKKADGTYVPYSSADKTTINNVGNVRVQILDKRGNVLVDSDSTAGAVAKKAYQDLRSGKLALSKGDYTVKVTKPAGVLASLNVNYAVQLSAGKYTKSYTSKELPVTQASITADLSVGAAGAGAYGLLAGAAGSLLGGGYTNQYGQSVDANGNLASDPVINTIA